MSPIAIRGARQHNLADLDLEIPRDQLVAVCGPSGSGKTSLVFDTIHAEGQRRYLQALAGSVRTVRPLPRADVDLILGLPPTIALRQGAFDPDARATVATQAEVAPGLRLLWARRGVQHCPQCDAEIRPVTHDAVVAAILALPPGTALSIEAAVPGHPGLAEELTRAGFSRVRVNDEVVRLDEVQPRVLSSAPRVSIVVDRLTLAEDRRDRVHDAVRLAARAGRGVLIAAWPGGRATWVDRPYCQDCDLDLPALTPRLLNPRSREGACPACTGIGCPDCSDSGLLPAARAVRWGGRSLPSVLADRLTLTLGWMAAGDADPVAGPLLADGARRLGHLVDLGLGHLALDRRVSALSTGEQQRIRLARVAGSALSGVVYALDEPAAGLGDAEVAAVIRLLRALIAAGNSVVVTEHHPAILAAADRVIELGPGAGPAGGRVVFDGIPSALGEARTATGDWLSGRKRLPAPRGRTLRNVSWGGEAFLVDGLVAFTGPSGSGKSRLFSRFETALESPFDRIVRADQLALRGTARSVPATFLGLWDLVRELLASTREAKVRGFNAGMFSLAVKGGRCEACLGTGRQTIDLGVLPAVEVPCAVCEGRRFAADVRSVTWKGHSADQLLDLGAEAAGPILGGHPRIDPILRVLRDVGLGYLPLGMPLNTLSGGESHRLALARELLRGVGRAGSTLYLLDGPTIGLHPADVATLLTALHGLVDAGGTVWLATHDRALAAACDATVTVAG